MLLSYECPFINDCNKVKNDNKCQKEDTFCIRLFKLETLFDASLLSLEQSKRIDLRIDSDGTDREQFLRLKEIEKDIVNFVNSGNNLYIYSETCGNGKSAWSIRLLQDYFKEIWWNCSIGCKGLFVNVPRFFLSLKNNISNKDDYAEHIKNNVLSADIVVWDDLGTKGITEFENEHLLSIIDDRMNRKKTNIFTSNVPPINLADMIGQRLSSRVVNFSEIIHFTGKDKRNIKFN